MLTDQWRQIRITNHIYFPPIIMKCCTTNGRRFDTRYAHSRTRVKSHYNCLVIQTRNEEQIDSFSVTQLSLRFEQSVD